jgi:hypothetical protein
MTLSRRGVDTFPNFHDGLLEGVWISDDKKVRLFLKTADNNRFTIVLGGVRAMKLSNIREGNIILDVSVLDTDELAPNHIASVHEISDMDRDSQASKLLRLARERGLKMLQLSSSYGAEGAVLYETAELSETTIMGAEKTNV